MKLLPNSSLSDDLQKRFLKKPKRLIGSYWLVESRRMTSYGYTNGFLLSKARHVCELEVVRVVHVTKRKAIVISISNMGEDTYSISLGTLLVDNASIFIGYDFQCRGFVKDRRTGWVYEIFELQSNFADLHLIQANASPHLMIGPEIDAIRPFQTYRVSLKEYIQHFHNSGISYNEQYLYGHRVEEINTLIQERLTQPFIRDLFDASYTPLAPDPEERKQDDEGAAETPRTSYSQRLREAAVYTPETSLSSDVRRN